MKHRYTITHYFYILKSTVLLGLAMQSYHQLSSRCSQSSIFAVICLWLAAGSCFAKASIREGETPAIFTPTVNLDKSGPWQPLLFDDKQQTIYKVVEVGGQRVFQASTDASASGLVHPLNADAKDVPVLSWQWRVSNIYQTGNGNSKQGDDFPARLYVTFKFVPAQHSWLERIQHEAAELVYGDELPGMTLNYIWANKLPVGTIIPNPYTSRAMMIAVASSGPPEDNQWVKHQRNIVDDFKKAFGSNPPPITGIGIMSDSDNTGEKAQAWYKNIVFIR